MQVRTPDEWRTQQQRCPPQLEIPGNAWQGQVHPNQSGPGALICNQTRRVDSSTLLNQAKATPRNIDSHFVDPRLPKRLWSKANQGALRLAFDHGQGQAASFRSPAG